MKFHNTFLWARWITMTLKRIQMMNSLPRRKQTSPRSYISLIRIEWASKQINTINEKNAKTSHNDAR